MFNGKIHYKWAMFNSYVKLRAGLRVCPERNELHLKDAHFTAQAQCFMMFYDFGTSLGNYVPSQIFGKISRKSEPFAGVIHVGLFPFLTFLELYKP